MWQETVMCFLNPQCWDSCDGVNAAFHFLGSNCQAAELIPVQISTIQFNLFLFFSFFNGWNGSSCR